MKSIQNEMPFSLPRCSSMSRPVSSRLSFGGARRDIYFYNSKC